MIGTQRLPGFVIVGAQKSASTFIQNALSRHPDVYMPKGETRFFEDPEYGNGEVEQLACLFAKRKEKALGIKRPDYLGRAEVPTRIRLKLPAAKIIIVLRNPVERLISAYYYYIKIGFLPVVDINEAIPKLLAGRSLGNDKAAEQLLAYGKYATHIRRYREVFPDDQIRILFQEDVKSSPTKEVARVCDFLGVDPKAMRALPAAANTGLYPLSRLRFLRMRNRFLYNYDPLTGKLSPKKAALRRLIPAAAITLTDRWLLARFIENRKPELAGDVRSSLVEYFREEIDGTAKITGRNLKDWR
jgi:hypothetical protein